jgi:2-oxo-4-hydroxy-4-carboxy-5-ureidoimidazoline decarboxylase
MTLEEFNRSTSAEARMAFTKCCGSHNWVDHMVALQPFKTVESLLSTSESVWNKCKEADWLEAFTHHPKIGDVTSLEEKYNNTKDWASDEQKSVDSASKEVILKLSELNGLYKEKFGFIFIVCATGKSAGEMLELLKSRMDNTYEDELKIAMTEQHKITVLRLKKLLS